ncbi:MAG: DUF6520 family protein [Cellulophaga sp.]
MKNSKKFKIMPMFIALLFAVLSLFAFDNNKVIVEKEGIVMGWTTTVASICDEQYVVDCSTTGSIECENFDGESLYEKNGANQCIYQLYKPY